MNESKITEKEIDEAMASFCPFGYRDVARALEVIQEVYEYNNDADNFDARELQSIVEDLANSIDMPIATLDPVEAVYSHYFEIARNDIDEATDVDFVNDEEYDSVHVYGNFLASGIDGETDDVENLKNLINTIDETKKTGAIKFLYNNI